jgi:eukaryotic-like serine/threonine-protein kinase
MTLAAGTRLGPYEILAQLGAGGMGEVYRAGDSRLGREVAIKVLPQNLSTSPESRQRFEREARTISQLSHPHICALYDVGREGETEFLVMELLEGETLSERLARGALPLEQALRFGTEIADALDKAHRQGIVHRDLKPGNIMLTKSGVKLLDFGLAKAMAPAAERGSLTSLPTQQGLTQEGTILGTFQYMAPEQLEGKEADARTDIFALGAVLYEMATGRKAFSGSSQASLISSIMQNDPPPISSIQPMTPPALDRVVKTCLAKDPEDRWQNVGDLRSELKWVAQGGSQSGTAAPVAAGRRHHSSLPWLAALVLAALAFAIGRVGRVSTPFAVMRLSISLPAGMILEAANNPLALSPDGRRLALAAEAGDGRKGIWIRPLDRLDVQLLAGTEGATCPFWSPDGRFIGFFADRKLRKVSASGGAVVAICDAPEGRGAAWGPGDVIVFAPKTFGGLFRVPGSGGAPSPVTEVRGEGVTHRFPSFLPDGKHVLFVAGNASLQSPDRAIYVLDLESRKAEVFARENSEGRFVEPGYLAFVRDGNLMVQPMDSANRRLTGEAAPVVEKVAFLPLRSSGSFSFSNNGVLVYRPSGTESKYQLTWFDLDGRDLGKVGEPAAIRGIELAPDERGAATTVVTAASGPLGSVWSLDLARGVFSPVAPGNETSSSPVWSPDGRQIAYSRLDGSVVVKPADGSTEGKAVASGLPNPASADWSPDGRFIATRIQDLKTGSMDIWIVPLDGTKPYPFIATPARELPGKFSPDGRWLAFLSDESGRQEVFIAPFPGPGAKRQVSKGGAETARWLGDGRQIAYVQSGDRKLVVVDLNAQGPSLEIGASRTAFGGRPVPNGSFAVTRDGKRLLVAVPMDDKTSPQLEVVSYWLAELNKN